MNKEKIRALMSKLQEVLIPSKKESKEEDTKTAIEPDKAMLETKDGQQYFKEANNWAHDMYTAVLVSRNRYKIAFYIAMSLVLLLAISITGLIPAQHIEPLLINHYEDGRVSVALLKEPYAPASQAQTQSEIVRYVVNRESFDPISFDQQYSLVNLLSNNDVANDYMQSRSASNKESPINVLGNDGYRTVHIDNVIFLDNVELNKGKPKNLQTHQNLAQINLAITDHKKDSAVMRTIPYTVLVSWTYRGRPDNPDELWRNWDGFTIIKYTLQQRNVEEAAK